MKTSGTMYRADSECHTARTGNSAEECKAESKMISVVLTAVESRN